MRQPVRHIPLTNSSAMALVDDSDYGRVMAVRWCLLSTGKEKKGQRDHPAVVSTRFERGEDGKRRAVSLNRFVFGDVPSGCVLKFRDGNPLNCMKDNLIPLSRGQAAWLRRGWKRASSLHRGVCFDRRTGRWAASVMGVWLGRFPTEEGAADAVCLWLMERAAFTPPEVDAPEIDVKREFACCDCERVFRRLGNYQRHAAHGTCSLRVVREGPLEERVERVLRQYPDRLTKSDLEGLVGGQRGHSFAVINHMLEAGRIGPSGRGARLCLLSGEGD